MKLKDTIAPLALSLGLILSMGCAHQVKATIPANAINQTDATLFRTIADFDYFLASLNQDVAAGNLQISPAQHAVLIQANKDVTLAKTLGAAYHNGRDYRSRATRHADRQVSRSGQEQKNSRTGVKARFPDRLSKSFQKLQ